MIKSLAVLSFAFALGAASPAAAAKMITYKGKVTAHPSGKLKIAVDDGSTGDWTLDDKAVVTEGRTKLAADEIHAGDEVRVSVSEDGVIHRVNVLKTRPGGKAAAKAPAYWGTQKGKGRWWTGTVVQLDEGKKEFQIKKLDGAETTHFVADAKTLIYVRPAAGKNKKSGFRAVREGKTVEAYAMDGRTTQIIVQE